MAETPDAVGTEHGPIRIFIIAGESSGDALGSKLIKSVRDIAPQAIFAGVGGHAMTEQGLTSLFPMSDIAVMGFLPVIRRLPTLLRRIAETARACLAFAPDVVVAIDSPDFTHRVAKKVRAVAPGIPIIDYVSPTVWAWRPGRARAMRRYVDHVMAILPFEPAAHRRLGGPECSYVGHSLMERLSEFQPQSPEELQLRREERHILILPGSRLSEVTRLLPVFRDVVQRVSERIPGARFHLPVVPHTANVVRAALTEWPVQPAIIEGEADKLAVFRRARAALAASGTVTLELALSGIPMVAAYRVSAIEAELVRALIQVDSVLLPNLILGENFVPEFLQSDATPEKLTPALISAIEDGDARERQIERFRRIEETMRVPGNNPSAAAARVVVRYARAQPN